MKLDLKGYEITGDIIDKGYNEIQLRKMNNPFNYMDNKAYPYIKIIFNVRAKKKYSVEFGLFHVNSTGLSMLHKAHCVCITKNEYDYIMTFVDEI